MKESFVLVSLKEEKTKKLSKAISNETCRKILNFLSDKDYATETQISKDLIIPISTVHYNLKALLDNGLVEVKEFHYSKKGREVDHYKIANKFIVIAPKTSEKIYDKLKKILPVLIISLAVSGGIHLFTSGTRMFAAQAPVEKIATGVVQAEPYPNLALWFLFGSLFVIVIYFAIDLIRRK